MNSYTKLKDGTWGVRIDGVATEGQSVTIKTKSGKTKTETIKKVLWKGNDRYTNQQISLCMIEPQVKRYTVSRNEGWRSNGCSECRRLGTWCERCAFDEFDN